MQKKTNKQSKYRDIIKGANSLSLGISIVVAVLLGAGIGLFLKNIFGHTWLLFLGLSWGIAGGVLNVYKAYKAHQKDFDEFVEEEERVQNSIDKHFKKD